MAESAKPTFLIEPIEAADAENVIDFLGRFFDLDSPISRHLKVTEQSDDVVRVHGHFLEQGCSFKAVHAITGAILGVFINRPLSAETAGQSHLELFTDPKFRTVVAFTEFLAAKCPLFERYDDCDRALEAGDLSVDPAYRGRGIGQALTDRTLAYAAEAGYPLVTCLCTSVFSARICASAGFEEILRYPMAEWEPVAGGERPLQLAAPHTDAVVFAKRL